MIVISKYIKCFLKKLSCVSFKLLKFKMKHDIGDDVLLHDIRVVGNRGGYSCLFQIIVPLDIYKLSIKAL